MYDLVIKNGTVIDPAQKILNKKLDIAITGKKIAALAPDIVPGTAKVLDASRYIVTPGLIDAHCHVYAGVNSLSAEPDSAGVLQAVTTVLDAGSAGQALFSGFPRYVIPTARTTVFCCLHANSTGLSVLPELNDWSEIDADAIRAVVEAHRGLIKAIKLRQVGRLIAANGIEVFKKAKQIAKDCGLPIMVHIGDPLKMVPARVTRELLPLMETGDILSHVYTPQQGNVLDEKGGFIPELKEAQARGVIFDIAPGRINFSFRVAQKCLDGGFLPTFIGSDVVEPSIRGPVYGLTFTMSRLLGLGLKLEQVIEMSTIRPARMLGIDKMKGSLKPGMDADVSMVEVLSGKWDALDAEGKTFTLNKLIMPRMCVKAGTLIPSNPPAVPEAKE